MFSIQNKKKETFNRKRSLNCNEFVEETTKIYQVYEKFVSQIPIELKTAYKTRYDVLEYLKVRDFAKKLFESTTFDHNGKNGGNNSTQSLKCNIGRESFLIPAKSRFFCGSIKDQLKKLDGSHFDIVVADPPWWNKYIRRLKSANDKLGYSMMYNEEIASLPVKDLCSANCLVVVWCTNAPSNIDAVKNQIFPQWGVTYLTTWYWVKVTIDLMPICPFSSGSKKQPYERIMIGKIGDVANIPSEQIIVSIPSALHSHKPPLLDVLKPYINTSNLQTLELFARYLLPNTTSIGYEPLKWQHISLYEKVEDNTIK